MAIDVLDDLKMARDLFIRKMRRNIKRTQERISYTNTAVLTADGLNEHNMIARRFELESDELERLLDQWAAQLNAEGLG